MIDAKEQEFLMRLRATFRIEAEEHLQVLSAGLFELEKTTEPERKRRVPARRLQRRRTRPPGVREQDRTWRRR